MKYRNDMKLCNAIELWTKINFEGNTWKKWCDSLRVYSNGRGLKYSRGLKVERTIAGGIVSIVSSCASRGLSSRVYHCQRLSNSVL